MLGYSLAAGTLVAVGFGNLQQQLSSLGPQASTMDTALTHLAQEGLLALLLPTAVILALSHFQPLRSGLLSARWAPSHIIQTLVLCLLVFPLVDPLLYSLWGPLVTVRRSLRCSKIQG